MVQFFLKAKHWQLFTILLGIPLLFQCYLMFTMFSEVTTQKNIEQDSLVDIFQFFPVIMILFTVAFFGWFWSLAIGLQEKVPLEVEMKVERFKLFFFIPLAYILIIMFSLFGVFNQLDTDLAVSLSAILPIVVPLHFFSMFCIFHCMYFVAKTIKTAELQREVKFEDFALDFFLIWFYFVGIWIIQPRVNTLYETRRRRKQQLS